MIPIRDVIPTRTTPVVTLALAAVNLAALLYVSLGEPSGGLLVYLALNVLFLWLFGENVEDRMGHGRFLAFYVGCGFAAGVAQGVVAPGVEIRIALAGGATAGVMGAYAVSYPRSRVVTLVPLIVTVQVIEMPALYYMGLWLAVQAWAGTLLTVLAGFVTGIGGVLILRRPERLRVEWWNDPPGVSARAR
jgi:membrane associated rhomboid family serine protease